MNIYENSCADTKNDTNKCKLRYKIYTRCYDVLRIIEDGFLNVLKMCKQYYPALIFGDYTEKIDDAVLEKIEEELLYYPIDELYEYSTEEQFANFCTAIYHICREVIDGVEDDYTADEDMELPTKC